MKMYCPKCENLKDFKIKSKTETYPVKGEAIEIKANVAFCADCERELFNKELDKENLNLVYSIYRKKHSLLSPSEIASIRKKYSLSQRSLGKFLEWGEITINRYETGGIQDSAHNEVLIFISDPRNMKELFEKNNQFLPKGTREKLKKKIDELTKCESNPQLRVIIEDYISSKQKIDEYSGFSSFDLEKMINMIIYVTEKTKGVFTTKLNKLLWYIDFLNFKECSKSISGSNYVHLPLGPVPDDYKWIIAIAIEDRLVEEEEVILSSDSAGTKYTALVSVEESFFSEKEKEIMDFVIDYFKDYNCSQIKEKSHEEKAYKETKDNEKISYKYAASLSLNMLSN